MKQSRFVLPSKRYGRPISGSRPIKALPAWMESPCTLQTDLDAFLEHYNLEHYNKERTHQGKRCQGRTPMQTFLDARELAYEKRLAADAAAENGPQIGSSEAAAG